MYKKIICLFLAVVSCTMCIIPAEAADTGTISSDLFTAPYYNVFKNNEYLYETDKPSVYFENCYAAGYSWPVYTDYIYEYCYFTLYSSQVPRNVRVKYFEGDSYETAEYTGSNGNFRFYKVKCGTNIGFIRVNVEYSSYTGACSLYSFLGIKDVAEELDKLYVRQRIWRADVDSSSPNGYYGDYETVSLGAQNIPFSVRGSYSEQNYTYVVDRVYFDVLPSYRAADVCSSIGFVVSTSDLDSLPEIALVDDDGHVVHVIECNSVNTCAFGSVKFGDYYWPQNVIEVTADLTGYDLTDLTIRLSFDIKPLQSDSTKVDTWYKCVSAWITPYIEELPWYKVFWNWLSAKWNSVTSSINNAISSGVDKIVSNLVGGVQNAIDAEKNEAIEMGDGAVNNANDSIDQAVPNKSEGFMTAISTFTGSMSYNGTDAVLAIPALSLPEIPGLIPKTELMSDQELDLESFVEMLPAGLVLLVRSLLTIALIIYCFKELYDTIAYLLTLRKGDN